MSNFHVGQKVVCVVSDDYGVTVEGRVYTVSSLIPRGKSEADGRMVPGITLHEVAPFFYAGFDSRRFRPVAERKTDISIFTAMLTGQKAKVDA